jgi:hypothetical protein
LLAAHRAYLLGWNIGEAGDADLATYRSDVPHPPLNGVLRLVGRDPADALAEARRRLDGVPRVWWVGPDSDARTADALTSLGAVPVVALPIMVVPIDQASPAPPPPVYTSRRPPTSTSSSRPTPGCPVSRQPACQQ